MALDVFAENHPGVVGKAPCQMNNRRASLDRLLDAFSIVQVSLRVLNRVFKLSACWSPVEDPDLISLPGKIFGQVTADIAPRR
jgi:hypothetical protein